MNHQKLQVGHYKNVRQEAIASGGKVLFIQDGEYHAIIQHGSTAQCNDGTAEYTVQSCCDEEILSIA